MNQEVMSHNAMLRYVILRSILAGWSYKTQGPCFLN